MIKLVHTADLHLKAPPSEESDYSLECLQSLIKRVAEEQADALLLCGDIFDKPSDYADEEFCKKVIAIFNNTSPPIYYIPGNHEDKEGKFSKLKTIDFGNNVTLITEVRLRRFSKDGIDIEILCVPHKQSYEDYSEWGIPDKRSQTRIAIAHGELPGFTFLGDEDGAGVLNPSIFVHHHVSHVFMGHIHLAAEETFSSIRFYYAGSPRPVRRRELGIRGYNIVEITDSINIKRRELPMVGVVRNISATVLEHNWVEKIRIALQSAKREDRILIHLDGMVLDMDDVNHKVDELKREFKDKFRRIDVDSRLEPLDDLLDNSFYKQVYDKWLQRQPENKESTEY